MRFEREYTCVLGGASWPPPQMQQRREGCTVPAVQMHCNRMQVHSAGIGTSCHKAPARVFVDEAGAIAAVKSTGKDCVKPGEVIVLLGRGPLGAGMPETAQITSALKYTDALCSNPLITDGRFSGFSAGPCIGHVGPEALAGGPLGELRDGDLVKIEISKNGCSGEISYAGDDPGFSNRPAHPALVADPGLPDSVRLWAALQDTGGGTWGGCLPDVDAVIGRIKDNQ